MNLNAYETYCILSMAEQKSSEELQCILNKIEKFSELKNVEMAKSYLSETWNIAGSITSFQAGAGFVSTSTLSWFFKKKMGIYLLLILY